MDEGKRSAGARPAAKPCALTARKAQTNGPERGRATVKSQVPRTVKWSARREAMFLEALSRTANVRAAARASGLSPANVYKKRAASDSFRAAWGAALREGYVRLETDLLDRALNGVRKDKWERGQKVGTTREYSDALALALLKQHRSAVTGEAAPAPIGLAEAEAALIAKLGEMNRRLGGAG
ncbi:hypothetical protein [Sphingomonas sp.]|uniref:hypothetical protein n=1 Tax=Sphingomonas sp. TaxID=28214 RepID=UPI000DB4A87C|nr:hypothetical protein [Sphingomonas sp.]PZU11764.1 MAG: hypothetical protein DI605_01980 [Sphingomonas sp.]